jgi:hypothetical protein
VYHTYTVTAPDPFVAPYFSFLLDRTPKPQPDEPLNYRKDEYPALRSPGVVATIVLAGVLQLVRKSSSTGAVASEETSWV